MGIHKNIRAKNDFIEYLKSIQFDHLLIDKVESKYFVLDDSLTYYFAIPFPVTPEQDAKIQQAYKDFLNQS